MLSDRIRNRWKTLDSRHLRLVQVALILLSGAAVYANSLHVQFVLDDYVGISTHGPQTLLDILLHGGSRRVADLSFALNYRLHGLQVTGYHLTNLAIHLLSAVTLYFLAIAALAALRQPYAPHVPEEARTGFVDRFLPLATALLFVHHPLQTQAVTYIIQRYASLATLFYLLSALFFIRARLACEESGSFRDSLFPAALSLLAALLALGSKQIAATLPVMLLCLEMFLFRGRLLNRRFWIACGLLVILALGLLLAIRQWHTTPDLLATLHNTTVEDRYIGRTTYLLTQFRVIATYLRLLCLPLGQSLFYDYPVSTTLFALPVLAALALHTALVSTAGVFFWQSGRSFLAGKQDRGELQRLTALGIVWFYLAMAVESSIFPITDIIFEHRLYLPSPGFFLATASVTALTVQGRQTRARTAWMLLVAACLVLGGLTIARNHLWSDTMALWQDTARKAPGKDLVQANLAGEYMQLNMPEKALPHFVRAMELNPDIPAATKIYLGKTLQYLKVDISRFSTGEELASYGKGEISREDRARLKIIMYNNLGLAHEYLGDPLKARESYQAALRLDPAYELAWYNLGLLSIGLGDREQTAAAVRELKRTKPYLADLLAAEAAK